MNNYFAMCNVIYTKYDKVALECDRPDLHQTWSLASVVSSADTSMEDNFHPWAAHPCGRSLLTSLVNHYVDLKDVQTAAALVAIFGNKTEFTPRYTFRF